jgi:O-antigen ligase
MIRRESTITDTIYLPQASSASLYAAVRTWFLVGILVYIAAGGSVPFLDHGHVDIVLDPISFAESATRVVRHFCAFALLVPLCYHRFFTTLRLLKKARWIVLLNLLALVSCSWSEQPLRSASSALLLFPLTWLAFYLVDNYEDTDLMRIIALVAIFAAFSSFVLCLLFPQLGIDQDLHAGAWRGIFGEKNACGRTCLFLLAFLTWFRPRTYVDQFLKFTSCLSMLLLIAMSRSATAWMLTIVYVLFVIAITTKNKIRKKDRLAITLFATVIAAAFVSLCVVFFSVLAPIFGRDIGMTGRVTIWQSLMAVILRRPWLGYGFEGFWHKDSSVGTSTGVYAFVGWGVTAAHNGYLTLFLDMGLLGFLLFSLAFFSTFKKFLKQHLDSGMLEVAGIVLLLTILNNIDESTIMTFNSLPWLIYLIISARMLLTQQSKVRQNKD